MATRMGTFNGSNVFLSRNLVPPEIYDSLHDALRLNGAQVFVCADPSRNSASDYHVISSSTHEKFDDLKSKGCNLIGPHCVLSCAKERRALPKQPYTCCLGMDGVKILASGFEKDEKVKTELLVTAMGGFLQNRVSSDISFVIVKNVLASKYKWAMNVLKKPVVSISWLDQCWIEHRLVPHEPHRILPFNGLKISVTRVPIDERKKMEQLIVQNGGVYSGDLTKSCTHLVSDAAEGDKYMVAKRWGHIHIVTRQWIYHCVARKACLEERHYPVDGSSISQSEMRSGAKKQYSQACSNATSQSIPSHVPGDFEECISQKISPIVPDAIPAVENINEEPDFPIRDEANLDQRVAEDSEDGDDLYLSNCRIVLLGFEGMQSRKLVSMILKGGGTRHMQLNEKLTHIIVGSPSDMERKEVRQLAAWGVINVVKPTWLEDCYRMKKEVPVSQRHIASDIYFPKDSIFSNELQPNSTIDANKEKINSEEVFAFGIIRGRGEIERNNDFQHNNSDSITKFTKNAHTSSVNTEVSLGSDLHVDLTLGDKKISNNIFKGHSFCFSKTFPQEQRDDIIEWVRQGGGRMVDTEKSRFIVECHGLEANHAAVSQSTLISSHWIRSCLEEGCIQDIASHILYRPLCCRVPFPGFKGLRFCVSQYETKERQLLRNLCFTLGSKCTEKLSRRVTHLLCKFTQGPKYEAACKWGINSVRAEWITECIKKDMIVPLDPFRPKAVTAEDQEAGLWATTQFPPKTSLLISEDMPLQLRTGSQGTRVASAYKTDVPVHSTVFRKKPKIAENASGGDLPSKTIMVEDLPIASDSVSDVASVIEEILEKSNEIQGQKSPDRNGCKKGGFSSDPSILGRNHADSDSLSRISNPWSKGTVKYFGVIKPSDLSWDPKTLNAFSETQTESQVVGYEEDLSGRQKIIDRVRLQSLTLTPDRH